MSFNWDLMKKIASNLQKQGFIPGNQIPSQPMMGMDPSMMGGGMPPMDPSMMGGGMPPMDPSMMGGGMPPMDPSMMGGEVPPEGAPPAEESPKEEEGASKYEVLETRMSALEQRFNDLSNYLLKGSQPSAKTAEANKDPTSDLVIPELQKILLRSEQ